MLFLKITKSCIGFITLWGVPSSFVYNALAVTKDKSVGGLWVSAGLGLITALMIFGLLMTKGESYVRLKPLWERPLALLLFVISFPLLLFTAILIRLESPGSPIYRQKRIGMNDRRRKGFSASGDGKPERRTVDWGGRPFIIYKLRSMRNDAENAIGAAWSTGDRDPRITRIGYYIRKTHLDELPQLLNVVLGHMSLVGPRPERPDFIVQLAETIDGYRDRLYVQPGITGLSQIRKEADQSLDDVREKLQNDREYIQKICLLLDITIALKTVVLMTTLIWAAIRRRTIEKIQPKTAELLFPENPHPHTNR